MRKKIAIGLSGGVDSAVAAYLLKKQGWDITAFTLKFYSEKNCCSDLDSLNQAKQLAQKLNIPHQTFDVKRVFKKEIINYFIQSYLEGLTPNPCVYCNKLIKFGLFWEKIRSLGFKYLATGHYANIVRRNGTYFFKKGVDEKKSQEYFLSLVEPRILKYLVFPLGLYKKEQVKKIAKTKKIMFKERKESQDACFVNGRYYPEFIAENMPAGIDCRGNIRYLNGSILGQHKGIYYYTYGQRSGLGVSWKEPLYVRSIDKHSKDIFVGEKDSLKQREFSVTSLNWFLKEIKTYSAKKELSVKIRYNSRPLPCKINLIADKTEVRLENPTASITPGQIAAFYHKDILLGGGIISSNSG